MSQELINNYSLEQTKLKTSQEELGNNKLQVREDTEKLVLFGHIKEKLQKIDNGENIFIIHQTSENNAAKILQSAYFSNSGLNGTALISNLDSIINACYYLEKRQSGPGFQQHKYSGSLIIMSVRKEEFKNCRNLDDIDGKLIDYIDSKNIGGFGLPNSCIWGYVNGVSYHRNINYTGSVLY